MQIIAYTMQFITNNSPEIVNLKKVEGNLLMVPIGETSARYDPGDSKEICLLSPRTFAPIALPSYARTPGKR